MRLMLDTHVLAWLVSDRPRLNAWEREAIETHADALVVSVVALWELRLKWRSNPDRSAADRLITADDAVRFAARQRIAIAPLTVTEVVAALHPPITHKDPFDEMLLIHAQRLGARLLTRDGKLLSHPLALQS